VAGRAGARDAGISGSVVYRVENGRIVEVWVGADDIRLLEQLG
jgi:hypothetical protein